MHTHTHLGMSQNEVSIFGSKTVALRGKKDTSFWDTPTTHTHIYICMWYMCQKPCFATMDCFLGGPKPTQDKTQAHNT